MNISSWSGNCVAQRQRAEPAIWHVSDFVVVGQRLPGSIIFTFTPLRSVLLNVTMKEVNR